MKKSVYDIITLLQGVTLVLCLYPSMYRTLVIIFFVLCMARLMIKIGNGSFFLELIHVYGAFTCLLMPLIGYVFYNQLDPMGVFWIRIMPVPEDEYFSFNLPAMIVLGFGFFLFRRKTPDGSPQINYLIRQLKVDILQIRPRAILILTFASVIAYLISGMLPASVRQINSFLYYSLFACGFYIFFYKNFPWKIYFVGGLIFFIILDAINTGMFTIIAYMSGLFCILLLADRKIYIYQKLGMLVGGLLLLGFIQLFKLDLRNSYKRSENVSAAELASRVVASSQQTTIEAIIHPMYQRMNQGFNIALVQRRIPDQVDYLGGGYLGLTFVSAFVPRLFWPDKPEAGGKENMRIYTGYLINTWSTNVGPLGEAYGNFGFMGGWLYLFVFGFFIRASYTFFLSICYKRPALFLWMPAIFFQTFYVMETDSLQAFNSLIKGAVFMFFMFKVFPDLFPRKKV